MKSASKNSRSSKVRKNSKGSILVQNGSHSSKTSRRSRSSNNNPRQSSGSSSWFRRFGTRNLVITIVFVLIFGGIGAWYVSTSRAATPCVFRTLSYGSNNGCVAQLQAGLYVAHLNYGIVGPGPWDGVFGYATYNSLRAFQSKVMRTNADGVVSACSPSGTGCPTWHGLCAVVKGTSGWTNMGCWYLP
ncbi:MAG TPA: peptidoglycan-binding domain-containing protein [Candidatus Saccharimonadales bacterium]|nr:peptidoglycan-binding domain-containing protein [Candidatus Saccharimonadales bacterium]